MRALFVGMGLLLGLGLLLAGPWRGGGGGVASAAEGARPTSATVVLSGDTRLHAIRLGQIQIKGAHAELHGAPSLRFPRIFLDRDWAEWMPILAYVVEHPEKVILVDTGAAADILAKDHFACDPRAPAFYENNLRFALEAGDTLPARLAALGLSPSAVTDVLITHFHADHVGDLASVSGAQLHTGPGNWPQHIGAFTCRLPPDTVPSPIAYTDGPVGAFGQSRALTSDGRVRLVPLAGHTPGHAGLYIAGDPAWLMVGDATFTLDQTARGAVSGVTQDIENARQSQATLRAEVAAGTQILPAHDWQVFARMAAAAAPAP